MGRNDMNSKAKHRKKQGKTTLTLQMHQVRRPQIQGGPLHLYVQGRELGETEKGKSPPQE